MAAAAALAALLVEAALARAERRKTMDVVVHLQELVTAVLATQQEAITLITTLAANPGGVDPAVVQAAIDSIEASRQALADAVAAATPAPPPPQL